MMKKLILLIFLTFNLSAREITPSDVYAQVVLIEQEINYMLDYYKIEYNEEKIKRDVKIYAKLKPRDVWQKSYEIMVKINMLRNAHHFPSISPVNMVPVLHLNPNLVYEQTQRIMTEINIFEYMNSIKIKKFELKHYMGKTPLDVFNGLSYISSALDRINKSSFTPSYVFAQNMRIYDDLSLILGKLNITDNTIPAKVNPKATPKDTFDTGIKILEKIKQLQILAGIGFVDFSSFKKQKATSSDVFTITQMIIAELQTIKAYLGIENITPEAKLYKSKTPVEVDQLMSWNLRKLNLVSNIVGGLDE